MNDSNLVKGIDGVFMAVGTGFGIAHIESIMGCLVLGFQLLWILSKFITKTVECIKSKDYDHLNVIFKAFYKIAAAFKRHDNDAVEDEMEKLDKEVIDDGKKEL